MKILYISALPKTMSGGPKYSVPNQVNAQAAYDEVYWINITPWGVENSETKCEMQADIENITKRILEITPDLVVFEDFYYFSFYIISRYLVKQKIPYVIVPRGCMTNMAQKQKALKKKVANTLFFNWFARHAIAIQFLTESEEQSGRCWNKKSIIVPNGCVQQEETVSYSDEFERKLHGVFIGRINLYHKGIDIFLEVLNLLKEEIVERNCYFDFYGPYTEEEKQKIDKIIFDNNLSFVSIHPQVHGTDKRRILLESDFFVLTSRFEGLPMGLLEAMSYGLPSLVTDETNIGKKIMLDGAGVSSKLSVENVKRDLEKILKADRNAFKKMSERALVLSKKYDWSVIAMECHKQYKELLEYF